MAPDLTRGGGSTTKIGETNVQRGDALGKTRATHKTRGVRTPRGFHVESSGLRILLYPVFDFRRDANERKKKNGPPG